MKLYRPYKISRGLTMAVGGFAMFNGALQAAPFLYSQGDLILAFRQNGNASDYVVNIGRATSYNALPQNTTITITNFSVTQFSSAFPSINGVNWSVVGVNRLPGLDPNYPAQTIWATAARVDPGLQGAPWLRFGQFSQGYAGGLIDAVGINAAAFSSAQAAGSDNTKYGVVIPSTSDYAFTPLISAAGDYGAFQGNIENTTDDAFDGDPENISRSDLWELLPDGSGSAAHPEGKYLGFFELKPDGALTFNTTSPTVTVPAPAITSIVRNGDVSTISFSTVANATYRLRATAADITSPLSTWTIGPSIVGDGSVLSLQKTDSAGNAFYAIEASAP